ncbi:MAG: S24 family peptidase [Sulfurimonas sp.]
MLLEDESLNAHPTACQHSADDKCSISLNYYPDIVTAAGYCNMNASNVQPQTMTLDPRFCQEVLNVRELESLDVIKVTGDSMEPYVYNGELVVIQRHEKAMDGETVIAKVNGHIYIKRYHTDPFGRWVKLISDNDPSSTIEISGDDLHHFSIVGIIRAKVKAF